MHFCPVRFWLSSGGAGYCSQSTFCSVSPCPHVFLRRVGSLNLSPHLWENFPPNFGKTPNFSPFSVTNSSPKLVNPQICPQILGQIRPQIWWIPKLVPNFRDKFVPKFGDSPNLSSNLGKIFSPNLVNPQICPQISGQIRPQICPQKAREHTSHVNRSIAECGNLWESQYVFINTINSDTTIPTEMPSIGTSLRTRL